jgi:hypothetical protein
MAKRDEAIILTPGSLYRIKSLEGRDKPMETTGIFKGYAAVAHDTALVIELDKNHGEAKGTMRLILSHMILSLDVLKAEKEEEKKESDSTAVYFG